MATLTIEEGLVILVQGSAAMHALIADRVYHMRLPQTVTLPALTYVRVSTPRLHTHDTSGSAGTAHPRFQFDAWAVTYDSAKDITDALRGLLNGYRSTITSGANSVVVQGALVDDEMPEYDAETELYHTRSDYVIWCVEG